MRKLVAIHNSLKDDLPQFLRLYRSIKKEKLKKQDIADLLENQTRLVDLQKRVKLYNDHIWEVHAKKVNLEKEIEEKRKMLMA